MRQLVSPERSGDCRALTRIDAYAVAVIASDDLPGFGKNAFFCPHCGVRSQQHQFDVAENSAERWGELLESPVGQGGPTRTWSATRCGTCSCICLWHGTALVYPTAAGVLARPHQDMPEKARALFLEAVAVFPHSRRAAAALARAALEQLLREAGVEGKQLDELVAAAHSRLPQHLWELLNVVRVLGNESLHGRGKAAELIAVYLDEADAANAEMIIKAINEACEALIAAPARASALYGLIPEGARESVEHKAEVHRLKTATANDAASPSTEGSNSEFHAGNSRATDSDTLPL